MKIYLAGKIEKHGWRDQIVHLDDHVLNFEATRPWPIVEGAVLGKHDYVGPYFIRCDHGCYHGKTSHGVGLDTGGCGDFKNQYARREVVQLCTAAIRNADLVFAWLNTRTAYGTLWELGYATALRVPVVIGAPDMYKELWFSYVAAQAVVFRSTAIDALTDALDMYK